MTTAGKNAKRHVEIHDWMADGLSGEELAVDQDVMRVCHELTHPNHFLAVRGTHLYMRTRAFIGLRS